ncbi:MAG TPA: glycosyltransferase family 4 protein [Dissulfurispiraceae bacterium]
MKKLFFIKKRFSIHGGGENYMRTLVDRLKGEYEITVLSSKWVETEGIRFQKVPDRKMGLKMGSFLSTSTFNKNVCAALGEAAPHCTVSFERTTCQDIYRAGEGCHAEWLEIRSRIEPLYKKLSFRINPLHLSLLSLEKELFSSTGSIIANSKMVRDNILKHYPVPPERISIIYNGVDLMRFNPGNKGRWRKKVREGLGIREDIKLLLFVGSGFKRKGLAALIDAAALVKRNDIRVIVIGKGDTAAYESLAGELGVRDRIVFLPPQKEIERFYAASDLFVLPTLYDPFSNATLEAMAAGIPVITTKANGVAELVEEGREGLTVSNPLDTKELAGKIESSLAGLGPMGENARRKAEGFPIERAAVEFTEVIRRTVGARTR